MKLRILISLFSLSITAEAANLETASFKISVVSLCAEGEVTCNNVEFHLYEKKKERLSTYKGRTRHSVCADQITPCQFQGYVFESGDENFTLFERGALQVTSDEDELILYEEGKWDY